LIRAAASTQPLGLQMSSDSSSIDTEPRCPECGAEVHTINSGLTHGLQCGSCNWSVVTTNHNTLPFDETDYKIFVVSTASTRPSIIPVVAVLLGLSSAVIRRLVDSGEPVLEGLKAWEIKKLHRQFASKGIRIQIQPPFPWPLETEARQSVQADGID